MQHSSWTYHWWSAGKNCCQGLLPIKHWWHFHADLYQMPEQSEKSECQGTQSTACFVSFGHTRRICLLFSFQKRKCKCKFWCTLILWACAVGHAEWCMFCNNLNIGVFAWLCATRFSSVRSARRQQWITLHVIFSSCVCVHARKHWTTSHSHCSLLFGSVRCKRLRQKWQQHWCLEIQWQHKPTVFKTSCTSITNFSSSVQRVVWNPTQVSTALSQNHGQLLWMLSLGIPLAS